MKFKIIFILFNIVVLFSLSVITIMPIFILGSDYGSLFWSGSWYYVVIFLLIIFIIDFYFIYNWKLFNFLEEERWTELISLLEKRIRPGHVPSGYIVKIMINAYMMNSDLTGIRNLGNKVKEKKPLLFKKLLFLFSVPVLLKGDPEEMEEFFLPFTEDRKVKERQWIKFLLAFSLLLQKKNSEAAALLSDLCREKGSPVFTLLIIYSLYPFTTEEKDIKCIDEKKSQLLKDYSRKTLSIEIEKENGNVIASLLSKMISDAVNWLFEQKTDIKE